MYMIYCKHKDDKKFSPLDFNGGTQVTNLIYATMWNESQKNNAMKLVRDLNKDNPTWIFELREKT